jgi:hypothetical protein
MFVSEGAFASAYSVDEVEPTPLATEHKLSNLSEDREPFCSRERALEIVAYHCRRETHTRLCSLPMSYL